MNTIFTFCVELPENLARWSGMSYEAINVWIFVVIHPLVTLALLILWFRTFRKYKRLKKQLNTAS